MLTGDGEKSSLKISFQPQIFISAHHYYLYFPPPDMYSDFPVNKIKGSFFSSYNLFYL